MHAHAVDIVGVPLDLGAGRRGVDMGPSAFRLTGLTAGLARLGYEVRDHGNVVVPQPETSSVGDERKRFITEIAGVCERVYQIARAAAERDALVLTLGGDHSVAAGSIGGVAAARHARGHRIAVMWIDAHADMNTPETSPSGNVHGMPLAAVLGHGPRELADIGGLSPKVLPQNVALIGIRDLDEHERDLVRASGVCAYTMADIDRRGISDVVDEAMHRILEGTVGVHVSLDVDGLDPEVAPGVGTPVRGGLDYRESHLAMEMVAECGQLLGMDVVEVNPILDHRNSTAEMGAELILSAFGKSIL
jgi:arginase